MRVMDVEAMQRARMAEPAVPVAPVRMMWVMVAGG